MSLEKSKQYSLSNTELKKYLCRDRAHIISYDQLPRYSSIFDIFGDMDYFILLYQTSPDYGHWVCVINHKDSIEFFDSLGHHPDNELSKIKNAPYPYLTYLLASSKKPVIYNNVPLQSRRTNVCGRWVAARINMRDIPLRDFQRIFTDNTYFSPDELVVRMIRIQPD